jgi:hypothetical protein
MTAIVTIGATRATREPAVPDSTDVSAMLFPIQIIDAHAPSHDRRSISRHLIRVYAMRNPCRSALR